ncbi:MAG TPA: oligosaccharide flippase family protein [Opitutaceae bacterium]|nr:oligosaccharide flippase family protein [Opitutaceae bacterium]
MSERMIASAPIGGNRISQGRSSLPYWIDIGWTSVGAASAAITSIGLMPVMTRLFQPAEVALHYLFLQLASALVVLQTARIEHFILVPKADKEAMALVNLCSMLGLTVGFVALPVFWLGSTQITQWFDMPEFGRFVWLLPLYSLMLGTTFALESMLQRKGAYSRAGLGEVAHRSSYAVIVISGGVLAAGAPGLVMASMASLLIKSIYLSVNLRRVISIAGNSLQDLRRGLYSYGGRALNLVAAHLMQLVSVLVPLLFIAQHYGADQLGYFSLVSATMSVPTGLLGVSVGKVYYQRVAAMIARGEVVDDLWAYTLKRLVIIALPVFGLLAIFSGWLYPFVFGAPWAPAGEVAMLMSPAFFAGFISVPLDRNAVLANKKIYLLCWNGGRLVGAVAVIGLARYNDWPFTLYILSVSATSTVIYLIDLTASKRFLRYLKTNQISVT